MFGWFKFFRRRTPQEEIARGTKDAHAFLMTNPDQAAIDSNWSNACEDEYFCEDKSYARAYKAVLRSFCS
jgi:hypothetical protein